MIKVLDHGEVTLVESMGGDAAVVAAARVSHGVRYENASKGEAADAKLIKYLMNLGHGSPFEHTVFTFHIKAPLFITRELMRHRIGSFNEISSRYAELKEEYYMPEVWRQASPDNKQSSVVPDNQQKWEPIGGEKTIDKMYEGTVKDAFEIYHWLLEWGVAREMARMVLPVATYTEFYWTVNARSLMNFLMLRTAPGAQWEMQQYAKVILDIFTEKMPLTAAAFAAAGRAP